MLKYESGEADELVARLPGRHQEPWLNALDFWEPAAPLALAKTLESPEMASAVRGRVIDVAAGTCWATARLSQVEVVKEVVALDLSKGFLTSVGDRVITLLSGDRSKIRFAVSSFNTIPFEDEYFDCAYFIATLHHCESPIRTLKEICRVVKSGGTLFIVEQVNSLIQIRSAREQALRLTRSSGFTELAYSRSEMRYLIRHSGFDHVDFHALDVLVRNRLKRWLRRAIRRLDIEHVFLPMLYVIQAKKVGI
jgi:ubiquinone/menaquinone biosynthesis C-methylase UbiE